MWQAQIRSVALGLALFSFSRSDSFLQRRRSMLPKQLIPTSPGGGYSFTPSPIAASSASPLIMGSAITASSRKGWNLPFSCSFAHFLTATTMTEGEMSHECAVANGEASLPPLEQARRRRSMAVGIPP